MSALPVTFAAVADPAPPLDTEVYARAEALLGPNLLPKVRNAFVTPHWLAGPGDRFWYRRELEKGHEDVVMDAATGKRISLGPGELEGEVAKVYNPAARAETEPGSLLRSPDGHYGIESRDGNLALETTADHARRVLTTDGNLIAGYGIWPDNWLANLIPRERSGTKQPPVETYWAPDSRTLVVPYIDQRNVEIYPYIESAPFDGSFRPKLHPIRIPLVGEHSATFVSIFAFSVQSFRNRCPISVVHRDSRQCLKLNPPCAAILRRPLGLPLCQPMTARRSSSRKQSALPILGVGPRRTIGCGGMTRCQKCVCGPERTSAYLWIWDIAQTAC